MKRFLSLLLVATLLITCLLTSCNSQKDLQETTPEETTPVVEDVPFPDEHKKLTEVSITSEDTLSVKTAAENLENYLRSPNKALKVYAIILKSTNFR